MMLFFISDNCSSVSSYLSSIFLQSSTEIEHISDSLGISKLSEFCSFITSISDSIKPSSTIPIVLLYPYGVSCQAAFERALYNPISGVLNNKLESEHLKFKNTSLDHVIIYSVVSLINQSYETRNRRRIHPKTY